ncbi:MAG: uncharacterized protein JWM54_1679 [Acidobacteriaceae bacterium]|nr:uncharacterized protein [Acidobacteriaceae bacterium]
MARENSKPGHPDWRLSMQSNPRQLIEGYASLNSVPRGGSIDFHVNTSDPSFTIDIFRMGWYGGALARLVTSIGPLAGVLQPSPTELDAQTHLLECNWQSSYTLQIPNNASDPTDWCSGAYLARLTSLPGKVQSYILFVVRDENRSSANFEYVLPVNTYQAYNTWHDRCLYGGLDSDGVQARKVSFNRPYPRLGAGDFYGYSLSLITRMEKQGYDVTYSTNVDLHENPMRLLGHSAFVMGGFHDEYYTWEQRQAVQSARDAGVHLAFFSSNNIYWQTRYEPSPLTGQPNRVLACYKQYALTEDPYALDGNPQHQQRITVRWRDQPLNQSEAALVGAAYFTVISTPAPLIVQDASSWVFSNTGFVNGVSVPDIIGGEGDQVSTASPPGVQVLAATPVTFDGQPAGIAQTTLYRAEWRNGLRRRFVSPGGRRGLESYPAPLQRRCRPHGDQHSGPVHAEIVLSFPQIAVPGTH